MIVLAYLAAITAANLLVAHFGPSSVVWVAFLFIGLDLTLRDSLHERWRGDHLALRMGLLIAAGGALSYGLNRDAGVIAVASCVAWVAASVADSLVYALLHERPWAQRVNGSNVVSSAVDSLVFPTLAFGALLPLVVLGQFAAKVLGGALWAWVLGRRRFAEPEPWELEYQTRPDPEVDL